MRKHKVFSSFLESQNNSYELLSTVVLAAIGVNIFCAGLIELLDFPHKDIAFILFGAIISIGVVLKIITTKLKGLKQTTIINGFVIYDKKEKVVVGVPEYKISEDMVRYLKSAFSENKALEKLWKQDHIGEFRIVGGKQGEHAVAISTHSAAIFIELLEYCVLEKLSTHLADYFNNNFEKPKIQEFGRIDIPEILLQNRFLKLFSEDMDNRAAFACSDLHRNRDEEKRKVVAAYSSGAIYERFDLVLPEKSKIYRKNKNEIAIETPLLKITITCLFGGFGTVLPSGFHHYYLGINDSMRNYNDYQFHVEVVVNFKTKALFSKEKETYYAWIDSFLDMLANYMGKEEFFKRINWDSVYTMIRCNRNLENASRSNDTIDNERADIPQ